MSAGDAVRTALLTTLAARAEFSGIEGLNGAASAGSLPSIIVDAPQSSDWGTKTEAGRELRTLVRVRVARGQTLRLPSLTAAAEAAGVALAGSIGSWDVASAVLLRTRVSDGADGTRTAAVEHRVRVLES